MYLRTSLGLAARMLTTSLGTADVQVYSFIYKNTRRVYLIDTPGFDDTNRSDTDVLKDVAFFLANAYKTTVQLSGIIYLHRITDDRMSGSGLRNLKMFKKLCGEDAYKRVVLGTTMWGNLNGPNLSYDTGVKREEELLTRKDWWGLMRDRGSTVFRHDGSKECAMKLVESMIERGYQDGPVLLNIQKEMIDDKKSLEDTAAGQEVEKELVEAKARFQEQISDLQESYNEALKERDDQLAEVLQEQREDLEKKLQRASDAQENLKISFEKLCEEKTAEYAQMIHELQEEKRQRAEEFMERQAELSRLEAERQKEAERHEQEKERFDKQREEAEERMRELLKAQKTDEAERAKLDKEHIERMQRQFEQQFDWQRRQQEQQVQQLQAQMATIQSTPGKKESSLGPLITLMAGVATSGIGLLTMNPGAVISGIGGIGDALGGLAGSS